MANLEEQIIEAVKQNTILYDTEHPQYRDNTLKNDAWNRIGNELGAPGEYIRHKWRALRDCYRRALIKRSTYRGKRFRPWRYDEDMAFLRPFMCTLPNEGTENFEQFENGVDDNANGDEISQDSISTIEDQQKSQSPASLQSFILQTRSNDRAVQRVSEKPYNRSQQVEDKYDEVVQRDHLSSFFKSMEDTLRTFLPVLQVEAKAKISALVLEYEMKNLEDTGDLVS